MLKANKSLKHSTKKTTAKKPHTNKNTRNILKGVPRISQLLHDTTSPKRF